MGRFVRFRYYLTRLKTPSPEYAGTRAGALAALLLLLAAAAELSAANAAPLSIEARIPLGDVRGRIDHLAMDLKRQRLYVAELGNNTVGVVDLKEARMLTTLGGLQEPQGIGYEPSTDTVYVANARDGSVRLYQGDSLSPSGQIALGEDADNVRVDEGTHRVWVGYGNGALAIIDPNGHRKVAEVRLKAHPESFRLDSPGSQVFVNVPDANQIAVVDSKTDRQVGTWSTHGLHANYPLALDDEGQVLAVFRHPAELAVFRKEDGHLLSAIDTCGNSDDLFVDTRRHRVYVTCGEGFIDVFTGSEKGYQHLGRLATSSGARTSLFVPELDRLYLAVRRPLSGGTPAAIWVIRPES